MLEPNGFAAACFATNLDAGHLTAQFIDARRSEVTQSNSCERDNLLAAHASRLHILPSPALRHQYQRQSDNASWGMNTSAARSPARQIRRPPRSKLID